MPKCFSRYSVSLFISQTASDLLWFAPPDGFPPSWRFFFFLSALCTWKYPEPTSSKICNVWKKKQQQNTSTVQSHLPSTLCHYRCRPFHLNSRVFPQTLKKQMTKRGKTGHISLLFWGMSPCPMDGQESYRRDCSIEDSNCRAWSALSLSGGIVTSAPSII